MEHTYVTDEKLVSPSKGKSPVRLKPMKVILQSLKSIGGFILLHQIPFSISDQVISRDKSDTESDPHRDQTEQ